jgi:F0F1-type ATP synthase assembly protein I
VDREDANQTLRHSHLGIQFVLVIGVFCYAGYWLDGKFESSPLFLFLGLVVGFSVGFYQLYQEVFGGGLLRGRKDPRHSDEETDEEA